MTVQEIKNAIVNKFGKADGAFSVRASGVWLKDGVIEIDLVDAGFQGLFFRSVNMDVQIPVIEAKTDEAAEAKLKAKLKELFPEAENVWTTIQ